MNNNDALIAEMQGIVREAAWPRPPVDSSKAAIRRAAAALGLTYRRARSFWYGTTDHVRVGAAEAARLRAEAERLLTLRLERLRHDIACTERLIEAARRANAQVADGGTALDRSKAEPAGSMAGGVTGL